MAAERRTSSAGTQGQRGSRIACRQGHRREQSRLLLPARGEKGGMRGRRAEAERPAIDDIQSSQLS
ncbi:hypothetical protein DNX69_04830 [Rhodopseudomonas palustris]|uniref:Uncharacterized protein n=1 Tax=Rhodopseudomonas palustris TaxID=1076 RepID=A0A323UN73_RHOPL|nr:hypothetical protein DNX69_04830 [Rhodopseudomonas palustris]